jgi:hypothetical protein
MALPASQQAQSAPVALSSDLSKGTTSSKGPASRDPEQPPFQELSHVDRPEITYPEGGRAAWAVAIGSWCAMTAGLGLVNSTGVLEAYLSNSIISSYSASATGWIFGIYVFVSYLGGIQTGPIFDARGPGELMIFGSLCILVGIFTVSFATSVYASLYHSHMCWAPPSR